MNGIFGHRAVAAMWAALLFCLAGNPARAGELRTLELYHVHTGETLTITYKRDGQYIPSAMAQLDYFMRDWRRSGLISMSNETIDLMWELHQELGSKVPIRIICGYRSAETNALLKRIGRHVAVRSQHILGRAIDLQFPDVPLERLRNSALVREAGGVGYYPGGSGGFVHITRAMCGTGRGSAGRSSPRYMPNIPAPSAGRCGCPPIAGGEQRGKSRGRSGAPSKAEAGAVPEPAGRPIAEPGHGALVASEALRSSSSSASTAIDTGLTGGRGAGKSASEGSNNFPAPASRPPPARNSAPDSGPCPAGWRA